MWVYEPQRDIVILRLANNKRGQIVSDILLNSNSMMQGPRVPLATKQLQKCDPFPLLLSGEKAKGMLRDYTHIDEVVEWNRREG